MPFFQLRQTFGFVRECRWYARHCRIYLHWMGRICNDCLLLWSYILLLQVSVIFAFCFKFKNFRSINQIAPQTGMQLSKKAAAMRAQFTRNLVVQVRVLGFKKFLVTVTIFGLWVWKKRYFKLPLRSKLFGHHFSKSQPKTQQKFIIPKTTLAHVVICRFLKNSLRQELTLQSL